MPFEGREESLQAISNHSLELFSSSIPSFSINNDHDGEIKSVASHSEIQKDSLTFPFRNGVKFVQGAPGITIFLLFISYWIYVFFL